MIPSDLYSRLRVLLDTPLPEVAPVAQTRTVQSSEFANGQRFTAQILNPLPDGTFKALVAGRTVTLSLPESVKSGDVLELVVSRATPQAVFAQQLQPSSESTPKPQLSPTAQLFSQLISGRLGEAKPAPLNQGAPLLAQIPASPAQIAQIAANIAPALAKAVGQSGLFYESHQAQWLEGEISQQSLQAEPQGRLDLQARPTLSAHPQPASAGRDAKAQETERGVQSPIATAVKSGESDALSLSVPGAIRSLVHQQLESLVSQQMVWQGQVWPGQTLEWKIDVPEREGGGNQDAEEQAWKSSLRLSLPGLGELDAELILNSAGVAIRIKASDQAAAERLRSALPDLADALAAAGVPLTGSAILAQSA